MNHCAWLLCVNVLLSIGIGGCSRTDNSFRNQYRWLAGKWQGYDDKILIVEQWIWNKNRYEGFGYNILGNDTIMSERLFLVDYDGLVGYTVIVNGSGPYTFGLVSQASQKAVFENRDHDFPAIISYHQDSDTTMTISLMSKESPSKENISYQLKRFLR